MSQPFDLERLRKGFRFEARQRHSSFDDGHFSSSPTGWRRYMLIDLKCGKLAHQDLSQTLMYLNYFDRRVRTGDELPAIGILLCDQTRHAAVDLTPPEDANIYPSKYQFYLPWQEELAGQRVRPELEWRGGGADG